MEMSVEYYSKMDQDALRMELATNYNSQELASYTGDSSDGNQPKDVRIVDRAIDALQNTLNTAPEKFRKILCVDLDYCKRSRADEIELVVALADCLIMGKLVLIFPPAAISLYVVRAKLLDRFCRCSS